MLTLNLHANCANIVQNKIVQLFNIFKTDIYLEHHPKLLTDAGLMLATQ